MFDIESIFFECINFLVSTFFNSFHDIEKARIRLYPYFRQLLSFLGLFDVIMTSKLQIIPQIIPWSYLGTVARSFLICLKLGHTLEAGISYFVTIIILDICIDSERQTG